MNNRNPLQPAAAARSRRKKTSRRTAIGAVVAGLFAAQAAQGQVMRVEPAIGAEVTYSSNGNQAPSGQEQADFAFELRPELWLTYQTSRLRANGRIGAVATTFIGGDRTGTIYPSVDLAATLQAIRNFFYVDADMVATRQFENPFAPRSVSGDVNAYASYAYRIAPYFQGELPRLGMRYLLRNDFLWTTTSDAAGAQFGDDGFEWRVRGELATTDERRLGFLYQYDRDYLKFEDRREFTVEVGRAVVSYRVGPTLSVNVRGGYEWTTFPASEGSGPLYGAGFSYRPTPRTSFTGWWEDRFFGDSWLANLAHRTPFLAGSVSSSRVLSTGTQSLFDLPRTSDVFRSIDAILTTRVPDPLERGVAVRDLMLATGLPSTLAQPVPIYSNRIDVRQWNGLSLGLLGARNSLVADAFFLTREGVDAEGESLPDVVRLFTDEEQRGASLTYSRRLTPNDSVNATALWQRTEGATFVSTNAESTQWTYRVQYNRQLRERTSAYTGARYITYDSNVFSSFNEASVFVGVNHRF